MDTINFERKNDCFKKIVNKNTILLWGDLSIIPQPWITVLIPTYKRPAFLEQAITSVLKQFHTNFFWDIIVLDNESYNGIPNENEKLIKRINNKRVLYYRNVEQLPVGSSFNRGIQLARGEWITMLHDDDILLYSAMQYIGKSIKYCQTLKGKELGLLCALQKQFRYNAITGEVNINIEEENEKISSKVMNFNLYRLLPWHVLLTPHIGCQVPTCGTTLRKKAVLEMGGFDDELGVCGDQFLFYNIESKYRVYRTGQVLGFWRWGSNQSSGESARVNVPKNLYDFRKYIYSKNLFNKILGLFLANSHNKDFIKDYIRQIERGTGKKLKESAFKSFCPKQPSRCMFFFSWIIRRTYEKILKKNAVRFGNQATKYIIKNEI